MDCSSVGYAVRNQTKRGGKRGKEKSYAFRSDEKYFLPSMGGNSIFASALAGIDRGIRLDWYLGEWKIDYCYIIEE